MDSKLLESSVIDELDPVGPGFSSISPETISNIKTTSVMDRNFLIGRNFFSHWKHSKGRFLRNGV